MECIVGTDIDNNDDNMDDIMQRTLSGINLLVEIQTLPLYIYQKLYYVSKHLNELIIEEKIPITFYCKEFPNYNFAKLYKTTLGTKCIKINLNTLFQVIFKNRHSDPLYIYSYPYEEIFNQYKDFDTYVDFKKFEMLNNVIIVESNNLYYELLDILQQHNCYKHGSNIKQLGDIKLRRRIICSKTRALLLPCIIEQIILDYNKLKQICGNSSSVITTLRIE